MAIASILGECVEVWVMAAIQDRPEKYDIDLKVSIAS